MPEKSIGHIDDFKKENGEIDYQALKDKVIDGPTGWVFNNTEEWSKHISPVSQTTPDNPEYLKQTTTPNYENITKQAQQRGNANRSR